MIATVVQELRLATQKQIRGMRGQVIVKLDDLVKLLDDHRKLSELVRSEAIRRELEKNAK